MNLPANDRFYSKQGNRCSKQGKVNGFVLPGSVEINTPLKVGYGACYKCSCKAFEGNGQQCSNCGHSYSDHW